VKLQSRKGEGNKDTAKYKNNDMPSKEGLPC